MRVAVVNYHKGNLSSVARGLDRAGASAFVTDVPERIVAADALVLPGVGSFADAMGFMDASGQSDAVREAVGKGKPFLGICLGAQLVFERGSEDAGEAGWTRGLGLLEGSVTRLESGRLKIPHVGWDQLDLTRSGKESPLLAGVPEGANMYFTHSYAIGEDADPSCVLAWTHYARSFPSVVGSGAVFGCQFHPEKSSRAGAAILANFVAFAKEHA